MWQKIFLKCFFVLAVFLLSLVLLPKEAHALSILVGDSISTTVNTATTIPGVSISGDGSETTPVKIHVTSGTLNLSTVSGVTMSGNGTSTVNLSGTVTNLNTALSTLSYTRSSSGTDTLEVSLIASNDIFFTTNNHLYRFISSGATWADAKTAASQLTAYGATGYLATITSSAENNFVYARIAGDGWLAATDQYTEKTWIWDAGPEAGTNFFTENSSGGGGSAVSGRYNGWANNEPNDYGSGEDCGYMYASGGGTWNDYPCNTSQGYVVEFGDDAGNNPTVVASNITITTSDNPVATSFSPADNATGTSTTANMVIGFSRNVTVDTGNIIIKKSSDNSTIETIAVGSSKVTGSGTSSITINPDTTLDENTAYYITIPGTAFKDSSNNYYAGISNSTTWNFTIGDFTDPTISSISSGTPTSSGTTITWTTNEQTSTKVSYGLTNTYGTNTATTNTSPRVTSHSVSLSNLLSCTTYHFAVVSIDSSNNSTTSSDQSFTTAGCSASQTPTSTNSKTVTASSSATTSLSENSRQLTVNTPANFTNNASSVVIQIKSIDGSPVLTSLGRPSSKSNEVGSKVFDVKAIINGDTELDSFDASVTITYQYTDADTKGLNESSFWLYHYHNGTWQALSNCTVNTKTNTITCTTDSFSVFALFGNKSTSSTPSNSNKSTCKPIAPTNISDLFQIDVSNTKAQLYFTPLASNVDNYYISYGYKPKEERFGVFTKQGASGGVLSYTINELQPNMTYYFKIRPHNSCSNGNWSNEMKVTTIKKSTGNKSYYKNFLAKVKSVFPRQITKISESKVISQTTTKQTNQNTNSCNYKVIAGDTLWTLALKHYGSGQEYTKIIKDNNLSTTNLSIGQNLRLGCSSR